MPKKEIKTILISGGTDGVGKASVINFLNQGFKVSTFSRSAEKCKALEDELSKKFSSENFLILQGDVTNQDDMEKIVNSTIEKFKKIDILFNNAGFGYFAEVDKVDLNKYQSMIQTNVFGMAVLTKLVVPYMKKAKSGLILNFSSISGKTASPLGEFYSATKYAVMGYSEGIRNELKKDRIKVATICPGMIKTDFFDKEELERRTKRDGVLAPRLEVDDVVNIISFICNQPASCSIQDVTVQAI